jgi:hypothetical protein
MDPFQPANSHRPTFQFTLNQNRHNGLMDTNCRVFALERLSRGKYSKLSPSVRLSVQLDSLFWVSAIQLGVTI